MSFLIPCPNCGPRDVNEFRFGGEKSARPSDPNAVSPQVWAHFVYDRVNVAGRQTEWWFHRSGCRQWLFADRDTMNNQVHRTWLP